jgi:TPR repeat protein
MMRRIYCYGAAKGTVSTLYRRVAKVQQQGNSRGISINYGRAFFLQQQQQHQQQQQRNQNQNQNTVQKSISEPRWWCNDERFHSIRSFSTSSPTASKGEVLYQQALQLMKQAKEIDENREQEKSQMMYEAWKKSQEKELNPKSQGVKVVKTLVKEARKDQTNNNSRDKKIEADELLKQAANDYNHPEAAIQLGNMLLNQASRSISSNKDKNKNKNNNKRQNGGSDSKNSVTQAMQLFRQAGEAGSRVGWYNLGHLLWTGFPTTPENYDEDEHDNNVNVNVNINIKIDEVDDTRIVVADMEEATNAFRKAIDLGDSDAMYLVGVHHLAKEDQENCRYGINLIEQAADAGHGGALYYLALLVSFFSFVYAGTDV